MLPKTIVEVLLVSAGGVLFAGIGILLWKKVQARRRPSQSQYIPLLAGDHMQLEGPRILETEVGAHGSPEAIASTGHAFALSRMADAGEDGFIRTPLSGLFVGMTEKPLDEVLAPVRQVHRRGLLCTCRAKAKEARKKHPTLSEDQCGVLAAYTAQLDPIEDSPYWVCNGALRSQRREDAKPWVPFIYLMLTALRLLPASPHKILYRGYKKSVAELGESFAEGATLVFSGFTSAASRINVMQQFVGSEGPRTLLHLKLLRGGYSIADFSFFPAEAEDILPPNATFEIDSNFDAGHGLTIIHAREIPSVDEILSE